MDGDPESISSLNLPFIEGMYAEYLRDPRAVDPVWREYFESLVGDGSLSPPALGPTFQPRSIFNPPVDTNGKQAHAAAPAGNLETELWQDRVDQLIRAYRVRGHLVAQIDPLDLPRPSLPELEPSYYGFTEADLDRTFSTDTIGGQQTLTLRQIIERLRNTYCRSIGVQFMHMDDLAVRQWLQDRMERSENRLTLSRREQLRIHFLLTEAVIFEEFIQKKFLGAKSFSLEGAESLIPLLELAIEKAGEQGVGEIVLAMAHRGRLNVLVNIMGKKAQDIFREFADLDPELHIGRGDVKYHLGHSHDWYSIRGHKIHLSLCFNPSHLEFVNPVAMGRVRAKQDFQNDPRRERGMCLMIHGDAAFAGEGIIQETLNLSQLEGYRVGGSIHVVVNNQIGFTTSPHEGRSSTYATDVAKMLQSPIFHVNGENPEAVAYVVRLAMDFRRKFQRDVVIDMYCYRRRGHNEGDEPAFTQPVMYRAIENRKSVRDGYLEHLLQAGGVTADEADWIGSQRREQLEQELSVARSDQYVRRSEVPTSQWSGWQGGPESEAVEFEFHVPQARLSALLEAQAHVPESFHPHPKIRRLLENRHEMAEGKKPLDWAAGESLALATLATEGTRIRLSGQDSRRGTFSHRHAVLYDVEDGHTYTPLTQLAPDQATVEIINSPLSEAGVLGFEYGYSLDCPAGLVLWEAQFGDFVNAAQVIVDQFIASAEDKWRRLSGIVLLLPHGFEGMGPEHSSARLERFMALAAQDNIQVVVPSTPAQYFHVLRRQVLRSWRKPLVVMTPKSLLRNPRCVSTLEECATGRFQRVIPDSDLNRKNVERVLMCCGKIYYELDQYREELKRENVAIVRVEQLYPLPSQAMQAALAPYADGTPVFWVQEEPENMGSWRYWRAQFGWLLFNRFPFAGITRPAAASPATGSASSHMLEQKQVLMRAFGIEPAATNGRHA